MVSCIRSWHCICFPFYYLSFTILNSSDVSKDTWYLPPYLANRTLGLNVISCAVHIKFNPSLPCVRDLSICWFCLSHLSTIGSLYPCLFLYQLPLGIWLPLKHLSNCECYSHLTSKYLFFCRILHWLRISYLNSHTQSCINDTNILTS